ncbi:hypothetical protein ACYULU_01090 [Breznakiellaceae bacterium SP9]
MKNPTLEQVLDELGITARVRHDEKVQIAHYLIKEGWNREKIVEATKLDLATVESLYGTVQT